MKFQCDRCSSIISQFSFFYRDIARLKKCSCGGSYFKQSSHGGDSQRSVRFGSTDTMYYTPSSPPVILRADSAYDILDAPLSQFHTKLLISEKTAPKLNSRQKAIVTPLPFRLSPTEETNFNREFDKLFPRNPTTRQIYHPQISSFNCLDFLTHYLGIFTNSILAPHASRNNALSDQMVTDYLFKATQYILTKPIFVEFFIQFSGARAAEHKYGHSLQAVNVFLADKNDRYSDLLDRVNVHNETYLKPLLLKFKFIILYEKFFLEFPQSQRLNWTNYAARIWTEYNLWRMSII